MFPQVLNMAAKSCHYAFPALSLDSSPPPPHERHWQEKPMTVTSWEIMPNSFTASPQGLYWRSVPKRSVFSIWTADQAEEDRGTFQGRKHAGLQRPGCIEHLAILAKTQHMSRWGAEQRVRCLEVSSWNAGCLATRSCLSPTSILRALA